MNEDNVNLFRFRNLSAMPLLVHAVSGRWGGISEGHFHTLNVSTAVGDNEESVWENRRRLAAALGIPAERLLKPGQVHGVDCLVVGRAELEAGLTGRRDTALVADGLVTAEPGLYLFMTFADCVPVLFYDPVRQVAGLVHAGWKGTVSGAAREALRTAMANFGSRPEDVLVGIGPSIGPCCYEVGSEVADAASAAFPGCDGLLAEADGSRRLDLWRANAHQLVEMGVPEEQIEVAGLCTSCRTDLFFSHRREKGKTGRIGAVIGLRG
jgi:polyphenol oxidase